MKKGVLLLLVLSLASLAAQDTPPVSIDIEIGKDTLALAEPVMLGISLTNHSHQNLILDRGHFNLDRTYPTNTGLRLELITPDNQVWDYRLQSPDILWDPDPPLYYKLPVGNTVSASIMLNWIPFLPRGLDLALSDLDPGIYRFYGKYLLYGGDTVYSDTLEVYFHPLVKSHVQILQHMDSLKGFISGAWNAQNDLPHLLAIKDSNTPYSEFAHAVCMKLNYDPDSYPEEKASFEESYPSSQFSEWLLWGQYIEAGRAGRIAERDSIQEVWREINPTYKIMYEPDELPRGSLEELLE